MKTSRHKHSRRNQKTMAEFFGWFTTGFMFVFEWLIIVIGAAIALVSVGGITTALVFLSVAGIKRFRLWIWTSPKV